MCDYRLLKFSRLSFSFPSETLGNLVDSIESTECRANDNRLKIVVFRFGFSQRQFAGKHGRP